MNTNFKNSGIAWIGQIPKHWEVIRNKYILSGLYSGGTPTSGTAKFYTDEDYGIPFVSIGDMSKKEFIESTKTKITKFGILDKNLKILPKNTILYSIYATIGEVAELKCSATISQALLALFVKNSYNKQFYKYNLKAMKDYIFFESSGTTQFNLNAKKVLNFSFVSPPLNEQKKIAEFLDKKCEIIDKRLSNLERKIKSLKEYKKSLITECVTKVLNPKNMEFKDSGIPWCPQIPSDWQVINPKILFKQRNQKAKSGEIQYTASQEFGIISQEEYTRKTGYNMVKVLKGFDILKHVEVGDFVISMRSFQGGLEYSNVSGSISSAYVMLIPNSKFVNNRYFRWLFKSSKYIDALQSTTNLIRDGQAMRYSNFALIKLIVPPLNEQKKIAEFLDKKCEKIDRLNENYTKQITALKEYKKSLIYECVTGKKEI